MGQRTAFDNRAIEAAPSPENDLATSRKQSLDASTRTDEASRDLAVQFLRMSRAARRAIAAQYEDADTSNVDDADGRSPMAVDPPLNADRRHSSFEPGSLSTLPYRPKDVLHNPRKHYRGSPSVDGLEGRTGMMGERRSKRVSDGSECGADFLSRCKRISNDSGYDSDARRHSRKAGEAIIKQETNALVPPVPFLCFEDYDESVKAATDGILYELRNTLRTSTPTTKRSSVRKGTPELPTPRDDEPAYQSEGLRRVRGAPTLRPENVYSRSRPQRPVVQIPANPGVSHSNEALVSDASPRRWSPASTPDIESRQAGRSPRLLSSGPPAVSSGWSTNPSRPHSAVFSPIEEHSDSAIESDDGTSSSMDSSVFSIPDSPIEPSQLDPGDPFAPHLETVVARVLQQYRTHRIQQRGGQASRRSTQQGTSSTPDSSRHSRKRSHSGDPDDRRSPPNDPNAPPDSKRPKLPSPTTAGRHLACPFWKRDPENHRHCYKKVLSRVKYVKQHLYRFHEAPISCACCGAEFPDERLRDEHVRARRCLVVERRGPFFSGGLTRAQRLEVSRRANPKESEEEQWFAIWDVIFPGEPRPASAYVDAEMSQDLCAYREFHAREGADILLAYLAACDPVLAERSASHDRAVLSRALDSIYDHWAARRGLRAPPDVDLPTPPQTEPSDAASRVSLAYGAPEGPVVYSYAADDVPAGDLPFADRGLEGLAQGEDDVYLGPDPRALMADLDNMFASVDDDDDFVPGVY
ncbi:hypothetical protein CSOJ01_02081 [Colletotrichum sojae]|uniref:C2H2-type domain-containing protein n=1 Tax=Colletotrichum sojae TaxID=2175907 RepID=A0A8H6JRC2_9PEZI|nr:hypothetical protein CSOJ01_02081 [Colletotrichum sojae]